MWSSCKLRYVASRTTVELLTRGRLAQGQGTRAKVGSLCSHRCASGRAALLAFSGWWAGGLLGALGLGKSRKENNLVQLPARPSSALAQPGLATCGGRALCDACVSWLISTAGRWPLSQNSASRDFHRVIGRKSRSDETPHIVRSRLYSLVRRHLNRLTVTSLHSSRPLFSHLARPRALSSVVRR